MLYSATPSSMTFYGAIWILAAIVWYSAVLYGSTPYNTMFGYLSAREAKTVDGSEARECVLHEKETGMRITIGRGHRALGPPRGRVIAPFRWLRTGALLVALALGLSLVVNAADAQPPAKVHRIGYLRRPTPQP